MNNHSQHETASLIDQMKRTLLSVSGGVVLVIVCSGIALGASGEAQPSRMAIHERNKEVGMNHLGQFRLVLNDVRVDSGKTVITLIGQAAGLATTAGGEPQEPVAGNDNLTGKKGTLSLAFRGISIPVNLDPVTGHGFYAEFGTWKVAAGTGMYKGWKGGGRWANSGNPSIDNIEWDGYITR
jgi:hypothetical protein